MLTNPTSAPDESTEDLLHNDSLQPDADRESSPPPPPPHRLLYWSCFLQGVGMLFPWNVFITAASYFALRFAGTAMETNFEQAFSFTYTFSNFVVFLLLLKYGATPQFTLHRAVVVPNAVTAGLFVLAAVLVYIPMDGGFLFAISIVSVLLCGAFAASLQAGIFGFTARLPSQFTQAVFGGQGAAGACVALLSLLTLLFQECNATTVPTIKDIGPQSFGYFFISAVIVGICCAVFVWLTKTTFVTTTLKESNVLWSPAVPGGGGGGGGGGDHGDHGGGDTTTSSWKELFMELKYHCIGVCLTFTVTLALFPGLAANIKSYNNPSDDQCPETGMLYGFGVWQSFLFLLFNLGDTLGRQMTLLPRHLHVVAPEKVWMVSVGRFVFLPLFMTCNIRQRFDDGDGILSNGTVAPMGTGNSPGGGSGGGGSDVWACVLMLLLAVSNGYCGGLEMQNGPKTCSHQKDQSRAGTLLAFFMTLGLLLGSLLAFPVVAVAGLL